MKRERMVTFLISAVLAFGLSVSAVGCMVTGFELDLESLTSLFWICGFASLLCSFLFLWKWGGAVILLPAALLSGYLWHKGIAAEQIFALLNRISHTYNNAYGWGVFQLTESIAPADYPLAIIGCLIAISASHTLCRGHGTLLTLLLSAAPLASCLVVTDTVPEEGYLLVLMAGLILLILTGGVRQDSVTQGNRLTVMAALPVILALSALFRTIPQEGYVNQSKEFQEKLLSAAENIPQLVESAVEEVSTNIQGGEQQDVDLKNLGARPRYTYPVMEVTADSGGTLYLRGQDYDSYTGTGWAASSHRAEEFLCDGESAGNVTIQTRSRKKLLYFPYYPADGVLLVGGSMANEGKSAEYTFSRTDLPDNWRELAQEITPDDDGEIHLTSLELQAFGSTAERLRYVTLPGETRIRAQNILDSILPENASRLEIADTIGDYVRTSAAYDLNTGRMPSSEADFALWFLSESDTGYCVHFATAAVVLLRAADIPARYVTGYMVEAKAGQTVTVTAGNAHAWAEYYVPQLGTWVVLEATPSDELQEEATPAATQESTTPAPLPDSADAPTLPETSVPRESTMPAIPEAPSAPAITPLANWVKGLLALAGLLFLVIMQRSLRLTVRKKIQRRGEANAQALARWKESELLSRLLKQEPPEDLVGLAQKAKFSQYTLTTEELLRFDSYQRACRQQLKKQTWYKQLLYQYVWAVY